MRLITIVFLEMLYTTYLAYLDNIIAFGRKYFEMLSRLDTTLERLGQANLKLKLSISAFGKTSVNFLRKFISDKTISIEPEKLCCIQESLNERAYSFKHF